MWPLPHRWQRPTRTLAEVTAAAASASADGRDESSVGVATTRTSLVGTAAVAGMASIGAGAIHAAAIGPHSETRAAALTFVVVAALQLAWGAIVLMPIAGRLVIATGAIGNLVGVIAFAMAKVRGLPIAGLDVAEPMQLADGMAAALALAAFVFAVPALVSLPRWSAPLRGRVLAVAASVAVAALTVPAMVAAGNHHHSAAELAAGGHTHTHGTAGAAAEPASAVAPKPYDPTKPIDLSGVPGVTPQQQARAENLISVTLLRLPKFADTATAYAAGYRSIGDAGTGYEHYVNWSYLDDDHLLDPDHPESLVYRAYRDGRRELQAAMYMLSTKDTLDTVPDVGGSLTQWHIHANLCFSDEPGNYQVRGLTGADGTCAPPLVQPAGAPMIHVWIVPQRCGPFSALEGIGAGQIKSGETRLCDHVHGGTTTF
jgi:hypothetical protein